MKLLSGKKIDATEGPLFKGIILYAIPLILSTLIQSCFNAVDLVVLGNMTKESTAVASVGATSAIVHLLVNTFVGIASGAKIILSRQFGARDSHGIRRTVNTVILTATGLGILIALFGVPFAPQLLHMTKCPGDCFDGAKIYLCIYVAAAPAILLYNFGSAILTSSGDSQRPMVYIIISGLVNVVLNVILCLILPQKVVAVAVATATSQVVAAFLVIRRLCVMEGDGRLILKKIRFHFGAFRQIMAQGIPLALTTALYPLSNLQIQSAINDIGVAAIAGNSAGSTIEGFTCSAISGPIASTTTVFMGQNIGAHKPGRIKETFWKCLALNMSLCAVIGLTVYFTSTFWLSMFLPGDVAAIGFGKLRLFFVAGFYFIAAANGVLSHAIQSFGHATYSALSSILCVFGFRMFWMWIVYPPYANADETTSFTMLMACFLVSWSILLLFNIGGFIFFRRRFNKQIILDGHRLNP
ncbi:MAG: MATE family efflux transporter [Ruminococcaceae bacterium]|nr:MATE family efflux transporter [Oscillospiraceae bacterium]